jgi:hypothetical protein
MLPVKPRSACAAPSTSQLRGVVMLMVMLAMSAAVRAGVLHALMS